MVKSFTVSGSSTTYTTLSDHRYLYEGWTLIAEFTLGATNALELTAAYAWGRDLGGTLQGAGGVGGLILAQHVTTGWTYAPCYDGNGNISAYVSAVTGAMRAKFDYAPFGRRVWNELATPEPDLPPFRFSTKYEDAETGLLDYGYRYYSPEMGRWISRDPIEEQGGINLYGMVGNDPVNQWDYLGLDFISVVTRPVVSSYIGGHYSLEYWQSPCDGPRREQSKSAAPSVASYKLQYPEAKRVAWVELINVASYKVWTKRAVGAMNRFGGWRLVTSEAVTDFGINGVSVVFDGEANYTWSTSMVSDSSRNFLTILDSNESGKSQDSVKKTWEGILRNAAVYEWAERASGSLPPDYTRRFPKSKYSTFGTNSNVFVRTMVSQAGLTMVELNENSRHPGTGPSQNPVPSTWVGQLWLETASPLPMPSLR